MLNGARIGGLAVLMFLCAAVASAQTQPAPPPAVPDAAAQAPNSRIYLDVVVDKSGQADTDLQQQDFTLLDNKEPLKIDSFQAINGREAPIQVIVVIDAVNAGYQNVEFQRQQLDSFLRSEGGNLQYPMVIVLLADDGLHAVTGKFLTDGNALSTALDQDQLGFRAIRRSAGFYGATDRFQICLKAMHQLIASVSRHTGRKLFIWLSPGWPLLSGPEVQIDEKQQKEIFSNIVNLTTLLTREQVTVFSIDPLGASTGMAEVNHPMNSLSGVSPVAGGGIPAGDWTYQQFLKGVSKPNQAAYGDLGLQVLVTHSGGVAFPTTNGIADDIRRCLSDSVPYYEISFDPPAAKSPNEYHQLDVKLAGDGLKPRTVAGYYAQP
jgi:VWFA-related protein